MTLCLHTRSTSRNGLAGTSEYGFLDMEVIKFFFDKCPQLWSHAWLASEYVILQDTPQKKIAQCQVAGGVGRPLHSPTSADPLTKFFIKVLADNEFIMWWSAVLLKVFNSSERRVCVQNTLDLDSRYESPVTVPSKKYGPTNPLARIPAHTQTPGRFISCAMVTFGFSVAQYTQLCQSIVPFSLNIASSIHRMVQKN